MTQAQVQAILEENARLKAQLAEASQVQLKVTKTISKTDGREWIAIKGISGCGYGFSATKDGWKNFFAVQDKALALVKAAI